MERDDEEKIDCTNSLRECLRVTLYMISGLFLAISVHILGRSQSSEAQLTRYLQFYFLLSTHRFTLTLMMWQFYIILYSEQFLSLSPISQEQELEFKKIIWHTIRLLKAGRKGDHRNKNKWRHTLYWKGNQRGGMRFKISKDKICQSWHCMALMEEDRLKRSQL